MHNIVDVASFDPFYDAVATTLRLWRNGPAAMWRVAFSNGYEIMPKRALPILQAVRTAAARSVVKT